MPTDAPTLTPDILTAPGIVSQLEEEPQYVWVWLYDDGLFEIEYDQTGSWVACYISESALLSYRYFSKQFPEGRIHETLLSRAESNARLGLCPADGCILYGDSGQELRRWLAMDETAPPLTESEILATMESLSLTREQAIEGLRAAQYLRRNGLWGSSGPLECDKAVGLEVAITRPDLAAIEYAKRRGYRPSEGVTE